jgi:hypothetical protein
MKRNNKASFEEVVAKFDAIWKKHGCCNWEGLQEWRKEVVVMGWTDPEFDAALTKMDNQKSIKRAA